MGERNIGQVTHYFAKINVAAVKLAEPLRVGDRIHLKGHTTDFTMSVGRMQVDHKDVMEAKPGDDVAIELTEKARAHDEVLKVEG
jgi:hypothetical protein